LRKMPRHPTTRPGYGDLSKSQTQAASRVVN
jgi:hypothetical protein